MLTENWVLRQEHTEKRHHTRETKSEAWQTMNSQGLGTGTVCGEQGGVGTDSEVEAGMTPDCSKRGGQAGQ